MKIRLAAIIVLLAGFYLMQLRVGYGDYAQGIHRNVFETFPLKIDEWNGSKVPFGENVYRILETDAIVVNKYANGKNGVILSMVYYPEVKVDFHSPEGCSTGSGEKIQRLGIKEITVIANNNVIKFPVNVFIVYGVSGNKRMYYYMYKSGDYIGNSYIKLRLAMAKAHFTERKTNGALVVFSTTVRQSNEESEKVLFDFIKSSYPVINQYI